MTGLHNIVYLVGIFVTLVRTQWNQGKGQFDPCFQRPKVPGPCKGYFPRFSYNLFTNRCERFIYGGCGGNQNNFETLRQCRNRCRFGGGGGKPLRCLLPRAPGPCRGSFRRFYYNVRTRRCEMFIYGGCRGNANRFETRNQCRRVCRVGWWG